MKTKTSITLSEETLAAMDRVLGPGGNRSQYIEKLIRRHLRDLARAERGRKEEQALREYFESSAYESDVLEYGMDPFELGDEVEALKDEEPVRRAG